MDDQDSAAWANECLGGKRVHGGWGGGVGVQHRWCGVQYGVQWYTQGGRHYPGFYFKDTEEDDGTVDQQHLEFKHPPTAVLMFRSVALAPGSSYVQLPDGQTRWVLHSEEDRREERRGEERRGEERRVEERRDDRRDDRREERWGEERRAEERRDERRRPWRRFRSLAPRARQRSRSRQRATAPASATGTALASGTGTAPASASGTAPASEPTEAEKASSTAPPAPAMTPAAAPAAVRSTHLDEDL